MKISNNTAPQPTDEWRDGYVAGLTRACVTLENFRHGDGPSTSRLPWKAYVVVGIVSRMIGALMNRVDELAPIDAADGVLFPEETLRYCDLLKTPAREDVEAAHRALGRAEQDTADAMLKEFCVPRRKPPMGHRQDASIKPG